MSGREFVRVCEVMVLLLLRLVLGVVASLGRERRGVCPECGRGGWAHDSYCEYGEASVFEVPR